MKTIAILLLSITFSSVFSQKVNEKKVETKVNEVTVFLKGAQITRNKNFYLDKGKTIVKFVNLSPYINSKSIQVKAKGQLTVLSVNYQKKHSEKVKKSQELVSLENRLEKINDKINLENTYISIIRQELTFLEKNMNIGGKNQVVSVTNLKQVSSFYYLKLTSLKLDEIKRNKNINELNKQKSEIQKQINKIKTNTDFPTGEILVKVDAKIASSFAFELSYVVSNAGWFPTYDIRAKNIKEPVQLNYKANVRQNTKIDWINAKLKLSTANPNVSGIAPKLKPYYLNYHSIPPSYGHLSINNVKGKVMDINGRPISGVSVFVQGTTIATVSDMQGNYSIIIPNNSSQLLFSHTGFVTKKIRASRYNMNVYLQKDNSSMKKISLDYIPMEEKSMERRSGAISSGNKQKIRANSTGSLALKTKQMENQTTVDFEIKRPYTIKSDNKKYVVDMVSYKLPASYQYYCVPKIDKSVFLIAYIVDWEKYNLLAGEANLFFEGTYVGKTLLDVNNATDTLEISLGTDKKVSVNREKIKNFTSKKFFGSKKIETRAYKIVVKNNKNQKISMILLDQVPVSTVNDIEVNIENISKAEHNLQSGEIKWKFDLKPKTKKEFELKYSVKYPKNKNLIIE